MALQISGPASGAAYSFSAGQSRPDEACAPDTPRGCAGAMDFMQITRKAQGLPAELGGI